MALPVIGPPRTGSTSSLQNALMVTATCGEKAEKLEVDASNGQFPDQLDKLLRAHSRMESQLTELQSSINKLPEVLKQQVTAGPNGLCSACASTNANGVDSKDAVFFNENIEFHKTSSASRYSSGNLNYRGSIPGDQSPLPFERCSSTSPMKKMPSRMSKNSGGPTGRGNSQSRMSAASGPALPTPHDVFSDIAAAVARGEYAALKQMVDVQRGVALVDRTSSGFYATPMQHFITRWLPLHPMSPFRLAFDSASVFVLMLDSILVPYLIAWEVVLSGWPLVLAWIVAIFWSFDLVLNLSTGYIQGSTLVMKFRKIVPRYLRGGFVLDLSVLVIDYMELSGSFQSTGTTSQESGSLQMLRFLRIAKVTRMVRVIMKLRCGLLARLDVMFTRRLEIWGLSEYSHTIHFAAVLVKLLVFIAWLSHVGACVWFYMQQRLVLTEDHTWGRTLDNTGNGFESDYIRGLYWSVSIMFSGASFLAPSNVMEAVFAACCISISALFVTSITSNLAAILIEAQEAQQEMKKKVHALNTFMDQRGTPPLLAIAVRTDFLAALSSPPRLTELDVPQLDEIGKDLRQQLRYAQYGSSFSVMAFVRIVSGVSSKVIQELSFAASSIVVTRDGDEIFGPQEYVAYSILLSKGNLNYEPLKASLRLTCAGTSMHENSLVEPTSRMSPEVVTEEAWICELALFLQWRTTGSMTSGSQAELMYVASEAFIKVITADPVTAAIAANYSVKFAEVLCDDVAEPSDLVVGIDEDRVLANTHMTIRELASLPLLETLRKQQSVIAGLLYRKSLTDLRFELRQGKSHLMMSPLGEIYRVVRVVVLRMLDTTGQLCVQLADWDLANGAGKFQLPGRKVEGNEAPEESIQRLLEEDFYELASYIRCEESTKTVEEFKHSDSFAVPTKYIKTVQAATFEAIMEFDGKPSSEVPFSKMVTGGGASLAGAMIKSTFSAAAGMEGKLARAGSMPMDEPVPLGLDTAFALDSPPTDDPNVNMSQLASLCSVPERSNVGPAPPAARKFKVYKWITPEEYDTQVAQPAKESAGNPKRLSQTQLVAFRNWTVRPSHVSTTEEPAPDLKPVGEPAEDSSPPQPPQGVGDSRDAAPDSIASPKAVGDGHDAALDACDFQAMEERSRDSGDFDIPKCLSTPNMTPTGRAPLGRETHVFDA